MHSMIDHLDILFIASCYNLFQMVLLFGKIQSSYAIMPKRAFDFKLH